jgi:hypothetical protein
MNEIEQAIEALTEASEIFQAQADDIDPSLMDSAQRCADAIKALQSMQGQAVGTVYVGEQDAYRHGRNFYWLTNPINIPDGTQLYTHPQSPAVPEKMAEYHGYVAPEDGAAGQYYVDGWNDCRDAMLTASGKGE